MKPASKSEQGDALIKIIFHEGTDISQAAAEVVGYVNRSLAFMPRVTAAPFITRIDETECLPPCMTQKDQQVGRFQ